MVMLWYFIDLGKIGEMSFVVSMKVDIFDMIFINLFCLIWYKLIENFLVMGDVYV